VTDAWLDALDPNPWSTLAAWLGEARAADLHEPEAGGRGILLRGDVLDRAGDHAGGVDDLDRHGLVDVVAARRDEVAGGERDDVARRGHGGAGHARGDEPDGRGHAGQEACGAQPRARRSISAPGRAARGG